MCVTALLGLRIHSAGYCRAAAGGLSGRGLFDGLAASGGSFDRRATSGGSFVGRAAGGGLG